MENLIYIAVSIAMILIGFLVAEIQNTYLGKQEKGSKKVFSFIGIIFTQKDVQRLLLALFVGIAFMAMKDEVLELIGKNIDKKFTFFVIGYIPSTIMILVKGRIDKKLE